METNIFNGPDYDSAVNEQRKKNILEVRETLDTKNMKEKIQNFSAKNGFTEEEVLGEIMSSELFAASFAIEPSRQSIHEKTAAKFLNSLPSISDFINLPATAKLFVVDGKITTERTKDIKSVDFTFKSSKNRDLNFFASHKYTGTGKGTTQKHQYSEIRRFLENSQNAKDPNNFFIAILDGPYYQRNNYINKLNSEFSSFNVRVLQSHQVDSYIEEILNANIK